MHLHMLMHDTWLNITFTSLDITKIKTEPCFVVLLKVKTGNKDSRELFNTFNKHFHILVSLKFDITQIFGWLMVSKVDNKIYCIVLYCIGKVNVYRIIANKRTVRLWNY